MFGKKKSEKNDQPETKKPEGPAYLREDYSFPAVGDPITDLNGIKEDGTLYEIACPECKVSIRSQGAQTKATYDQLMNGKGCIGCGNRKLEIRQVVERRNSGIVQNEQ